MYFVYILKSIKRKTYYKGRTDNLERRLREHEHGKTISNKFSRPFQLVHVDVCSNLEEAMRLEKFFKTGYGREIIKEIDADVAELVYAQS